MTAAICDTNRQRCRARLPASAKTTYPCQVELAPRDPDQGVPLEANPKSDSSTATAVEPVASRRRSPVSIRNAAQWFYNTNRSPGLVGFARRARRLLPGDPEFGDPLSTAGEGGPRAAARAADRLLGDRNAASREVSLSVLQVWQALTESVSRRPANPQV